MTFKLYNAPQSTCSQRVRFVFNAKKIPFDEVKLNLLEGDQLRPDYLKLNPNGVVPTLDHDGAIVIDSTVITEYLDEVAPQASCPNELARISIDFASEKLADKLAAYTTGDAVLVIVEGVLVYLEESQIAELAGALAALFPQHTLACDMSSRAFHERTQDSPTQLGLMPIPRFGARFFLPKVIREGLSICVFERG